MKIRPQMACVLRRCYTAIPYIPLRIQIGSIHSSSRTSKDATAADLLVTVQRELKLITGQMLNLLGSGHPSLDRVAKYYIKTEGKCMRGLIVLSMSKAIQPCPRNAKDITPEAVIDVDAPISPLHILADTNPNEGRLYKETQEMQGLDILPSQRRLAEITEVIHIASLLHDDVIDQSILRRGLSSANIEFGNKMAILGGDFLLGRATVALARLRNPQVTEAMATAVSDLIEGESMQLQNTARGNHTARDSRNPVWSEETLNHYLEKTFLKTGSLISNSCHSAAILGNASPQTQESAYQYGRNLGIAFQLVDDIKDFTQTAGDLGKPAGADLQQGLATAPVLFAWKQFPELGPLVGRRFSQDDDIEKAHHLIFQSNAIEQTRLLAQDYVEKAVKDILDFPDSKAKYALIDIARRTIQS